jgi:hypothetical protein
MHMYMLIVYNEYAKHRMYASIIYNLYAKYR